MNTATCSNIGSKANLKFWDAPHPNDSWRYMPKSKVARSLAFAETAWKKREKDVITIISPFEEKYEKAKSRIVRLCSTQIEVNAPNQIARQLALDTLTLLKENGVFPSLINSTGDESLIFEFFVKEDFYLIEFYNSGELIFLRRVKNQPKFTTEINAGQLKEITKEIAHAYARVDL